MIFESAAATSVCAAGLLGGPTWALPPIIGLMTGSDESQQGVADKYAKTADLLNTSKENLGKTKTATAPEEWTAKDKAEFNNNVTELVKQIDQAVRGVKSACDTVQCSATTTTVSGYVCLTASAALLTTAWLSTVTIPLGPVSPMMRLAGWAKASRIYTVLSGVLEKQGMVAAAAGGVLLIVAGLHEYEAQTIAGEAKTPEGGSPDFKKVKMNWAQKA
ncbi:hypothetical protein [Nonomuraea sediminis]|uniref:hypothetical protein n=1 Tax=Nonomuraea sediminis TaxID=2835864 RepID=UPI001BDCAB6B|nr:hypothetical protein [Nonomuraea sediminis]